MIKLTKLLKHKNKPKPLFNPGELAIYNPSRNFIIGNELDELYLVKFRRFRKYKDNPKKQWYYFGSTLKFEQTTSESLPYAPFFKKGCVNTPEEHLHKLEEIRYKAT